MKSIFKEVWSNEESLNYYNVKDYLIGLESWTVSHLHFVIRASYAEKQD